MFRVVFGIFFVVILPATSFACPADVWGVDPWQETPKELFGETRLSAEAIQAITEKAKFTPPAELKGRFDQAMNHVTELLDKTDSQLVELEGNTNWHADVARTLRNLKTVIRADLQRKTDDIEVREEAADFQLQVWSVADIQKIHGHILETIYDLKSQYGGKGYPVSVGPGMSHLLESLQRKATSDHIMLQSRADIYAEIQRYLNIIESILPSTSQEGQIATLIHWFRASKVKWQIIEPKMLYEIKAKWDGKANPRGYKIIGIVKENSRGDFQVGDAIPSNNSNYRSHHTTPLLEVPMYKIGGTKGG